MKLESIDVEAAIAKTKQLLDEEPGISPTLKASIELLLLLMSILLNRLGLNSQNSSKPPSSDPNREKRRKKSGGQKGHNGTTLQKVFDPDIIKPFQLEKSALPCG